MEPLIASLLVQRKQYQTRSHARTSEQMTAFDEGIESSLCTMGRYDEANEYQDEAGKLDE